MVYSMGTGSKGELGHGTVCSEQEPRLVEHLRPIKVVQVACGAWHSVALTDGGEVYVWGWNKCGQLGDSCEPNEIIDIPFLLDLDDCVIQIHAVGHATFLRCSSNSTLAFGKADLI
ncbi:unnamed protein product [Thelazia callipaeda]|uniref:Ultraviolet-B receptor UVR8 n=1 Tax=Thelazia callipaeda TaxID=103827 RepID=A0A0N5CVV2_THECL|nr:unnamed protein product [Thelazia callipaeda]